MKFDSTKVWPHPVLRPHGFNDDYPNAEFEVDIDLKLNTSSTSVGIDVSFILSEPTLQELIEMNEAKYMVLIRSPQTHVRTLLTSKNSELHHEFVTGTLAGRVEFSPFLICTTHKREFRCPAWHSEFDGYTFELSAGSVLAEDEPKVYWIDTNDQAPLGSIFAHYADPELTEGVWDIDLHENQISILMNEQDNETFKKTRERIKEDERGQYLMNGLYLPILIAVLDEVDQNTAEYEDKRWFNSLTNRLADVGASSLGTNKANRVIDAQKILERPFLKMPIICEENCE